MPLNVRGGKFRGVPHQTGYISDPTVAVGGLVIIVNELHSKNLTGGEEGNLQSRGRIGRKELNLGIGQQHRLEGRLRRGGGADYLHASVAYQRRASVAIELTDGFSPEVGWEGCAGIFV